MAINLASKYEKKVDEKFKLNSLTDAAVNHEYTWEGVNTINVYSIPTVAMNNYNPAAAASRYGTASELQNNVQAMLLARDRSFTFTIDRLNHQDSQMVMEAGRALARQIEEVYVPEVDTYRLGKMSAAAIANTGHSATVAITASNAYSSFLTGQEKLNDKKVPIKGRIAFVTPAYYSFLKLDPSFLKASDLSVKTLINGQVGEVDGVKIVMIPNSYFPANHAFIITHPVATVAANKLTDYKTHDNPPGINGWLVEGRARYDAFVLDNKKDAIYVHKIAA